MLPYLPPSELVSEEEREREPAYRNWGEYLSSSTNSLDQFAQTCNRKKKTSSRKSRVPSHQEAISNKDSSKILQIEQTESAHLLTRKVKSSKSMASVASSVITPTEESVLPTTSKDVENPPSTSNRSTSHYVIPKKGIQANRLNELALKVSPPARPILPKPPVTIRTSPPQR